MRTSLRLAVALLLVVAGGCGKKDATPAATPAARTVAPAATVAPTSTVAAAPAAAPVKDAVFSPPELDQMVAPIALYPDPLLAQVLMAATYPGDVADAAAWSKQNPKATGDAAVQQVASQPWDPSVQSLVAFPQALATLGQDPAWVQRLGDAFLAQPDDVMDAVQRLRHQAQSAGNLESNKYQTVSVSAAPAPAAGEAAPMETAPMQGGMESGQSSQSTIVIAPSDPEVVYVPSYNPTEVYGAWPNPGYPPAYYPPPPAYYAGSALMAGLAFGTGVAITNALWGDMNWGGDDIDINVNRYNNINVNSNINASSNRWQHNAVNRDGVPYRDRASREQYDRRLPGAESREGFRGDSNPQRAQAREQARASMERRGVEPRANAGTGTRDLAGGGNRDQARDRARAATSDNAARERARNASGNAGQRDRAQQTARDRAGVRRARAIASRWHRTMAHAASSRNRTIARAANPRRSRGRPRNASSARSPARATTPSRARANRSRRARRRNAARPATRRRGRPARAAGAAAASAAAAHRVPRDNK